MLETVRQFAVERLAGSGERDRARRRHFDYYAQLAADSAPRLSTTEQRAALALLDPEVHNLRAALEWALEAAPADALALAGDLGEYWLARETFLEKRWLTAALDAAGEQAPTTDRARAWLLWAQMFLLDDDAEVVIAGAQSALDLYVEAGDHAGIAMALSALARLMAGLTGDVEGARRHLEEALGHARVAGDEHVLGKVLARLAVVTAPPNEFLERAVAILAPVGDFQELARTYSNCGARAVLENRLEQATELLEAALDAVQRADCVYVHTAICSNTGLARLFAGDQVRARAAFSEALALIARHGTHDVTGEVMAGLSGIAAAEGDAAAAARFKGAWRAVGYPLSHFDTQVDERIEHEHRARARQRLGGHAWAMAEAEGAAMSLDEAIANGRAWVSDPGLAATNTGSRLRSVSG
jgi:tetratricopeptide (TPR) repeat protein